MKKSLQVIASAAIAMSAFASVAMADDAATTTTGTSVTATAATKTSADFKDLANVDAALKAKIDAMLKAGVFEGVSNDSFGIDQNMTRAQAAKVLTLIYNIKVDTTVKTSSFTDVKADDAANGWAIPYIEAAKKAGLIDGVSDTTFAPGDNVTVGQFAKLLVVGLGKKVDVTGTPWYADAIKQAVALNLLPANTDGSKLATRADLVGGAYSGQQAYNDANKPAQVSVASVKATGFKTVVVNFDRDVDTTKATVSLKKGSTDVATTVKFADDKKSATLTLTTTKLSAGDYTVTLGGLDASAIKTATGTFTAQDETVSKIEFVSAADTVARSAKVKLQVKASNQYGENASFSAGNYTVYATTNNNTPTISKDASGNLYVNLDTSNLTPNLSQVSVNIYDNSHNASVSKVFKVGDQPYISKVELGTVTYSNGGTSLSNVGDKAVVALKMYDQFGGIIAQKADSQVPATAYATPYDTNLDTSITDDNGDGYDDLVVTLKAKVTAATDYTVSVFGGASTATAKVSVNPVAVASKIAFGQLNGTFATGDKDKYIDLVAYDASGNQLTADQIAQNAKDGRFTITTSSNLVTAATTGVPASILDSKAQVVIAGPNKGKLHISYVGDKGTGYVSIGIYAVGVSSSSQLNVPINDVRYPVSINVTSENPTKTVATSAGSGITTTATGHIKLIDQYGSVITGFSTDNTGATIALKDSQGNTVTYDVYATTSGNGLVTPKLNGTTVTNGANFAVSAASDKDFTFVTAPGAAAGDNAQVTYTLRKLKLNSDSTWSVADGNVASVTRKTTVINPNNETLTYSLNSIKDLFAAINDGTYPTSAANGEDIANPTSFGNQRHEVTISAKDAAGNAVAFSKSITNVTSDTYSVANGLSSGWVIGNNAGKANLTVIFKDAKGNSQTLSTAVNVKADLPYVASIAADNNGASKTVSGGTINNLYAYDILGNVDIYDQYGTEYKNANGTPTTNIIYNFDKYLGVRYYIGDVVWTGVAGTVSVSDDGKITVSNGTNADGSASTIKSATITAIAPTGKSVSTYVAVTP